MVELVYTLLIMGGVIAGLKIHADSQSYKIATAPHIKLEPTKIKIKAKPKAKVEEDPNLKVAKTTLIASGWTATEAKQMLADITASTPDEYISKAMMKVKI